MKLKLLFIAIATSFLAGCDSPTGYAYKSQSPLAEPIRSSASVYIGLVGDGSGDGKISFGSGQLATSIIGSVARANFKNVFVGSQLRSVDENTAAAAAQKCDYLFETKIINWEDNNTPWSGLADRVNIELTTINVLTLTVVNIGTIDIMGPGWTLKDGKPEELLGAGVDTYIKFLQGGTLPKPLTRPDPRPPSQH